MSCTDLKKIHMAYIYATATGKGIRMAYIYAIRRERVKMRFETFWIYSDQKKLTKIFDLVIFSLFWAFWPKND